jgi:hypothetical protein
LPADTNIDRITYNGNLAASVSELNYLQGPSAGYTGTKRKYFSNRTRILNLMDIKMLTLMNLQLGYQLQLTDEGCFVWMNITRGKLNSIKNLNAAAVTL